MSYTYEHNLDNYGYPFAPGPGGRLRKQAIRASKSILGKCIYLVMSLIGVLLWLGRLGRKHRPLTPLSAHPRRILVIRLDLIGDLVLSMTVGRALTRTYPEVEIDLRAVPASSKALHNDPTLSQ